MKLVSILKTCQCMNNHTRTRLATWVLQQNRLLSNTVDDQPPLPEYQERKNESLGVQKARLLYQSRKRGMLENGLLLRWIGSNLLSQDIIPILDNSISTFAAKYLNSFNETETQMYDKLINKPSNDWEIYYWAIGNKPTPEEYDNKIMELLKQHAENKDLDVRIRQPDL